LKNILETKIGNINGFSRWLDWKVETENNNNNQILIKKARDKNKEVFRAVEEIKKIKVKELQGEEWQIKGDLILKEEKVYMSKYEE